MSHCSKGWDLRCPKSKGKKCRCSCGGKNHGNFLGTIPLWEDGANFEYVAVDNFVDDVVVIRDLGPWDRFKTITNAPEGVVARVLKDYPKTKRLFYYDSNGDKDELVIKDGKFAGFRPGTDNQRSFKNG